MELVTEAVCAGLSSASPAMLVRTPDGSALTFDMDSGGQAVHVLATADEPDHQHQRKLVLPTWSPNAYELFEPTMLEYTQPVVGQRLRRSTIRPGHVGSGHTAFVVPLIDLPAHDVPNCWWSYDSTELLRRHLGRNS